LLADVKPVRTRRRNPCDRVLHQPQVGPVSITDGHARRVILAAVVDDDDFESSLTAASGRHSFGYDRLYVSASLWAGMTSERWGMSFSDQISASTAARLSLDGSFPFFGLGRVATSSWYITAHDRPRRCRQ